MIVNKPTNSIRPYEKNAKKHPDDQIEKIARSIQEFGFNQPIVIDGQNVVIVGHGRLAAAKKLGLQEVPTFMVNLSKEQADAYRLADNKLNESDWDMELVIEELKDLDIKGFDISLTGFELDEFAPVTVEEDDFEVEPPIEPKSAHGDVFALGEHRLMCGDATKRENVEKLMNGQKADMAWTDPPYNVDYEGGTGLKIQNDNMDDDSFRQFLKDSYDQFFFALSEGSPIYVAHASSEAYNFIGAFKDAGFKLAQTIVWVKNSLVLGRQDYQWQHEPILYGWKEGVAHKWYGMYDKTTVVDDEIDIRKMKREELVKIVNHLRNERKTDVVREDKPSRNGEHPTMKPIKLITKFIFNSSEQENIVLDLFGGSGSTLIACEQTNRKCYMMELDPKYVDVIISRWEKFTGNKAEKIC